MRKERELEDKTREMALTFEKCITDSLSEVREQAKSDAEESLSLKVIERDAMIGPLQEKIGELKKKARKGRSNSRERRFSFSLADLLAGAIVAPGFQALTASCPDDKKGATL